MYDKDIDFLFHSEYTSRMFLLLRSAMWVWRVGTAGEGCCEFPLEGCCDFIRCADSVGTLFDGGGTTTTSLYTLSVARRTTYHRTLPSCSQLFRRSHVLQGLAPEGNDECL